MFVEVLTLLKKLRKGTALTLAVRETGSASEEGRSSRRRLLTEHRQGIFLFRLHGRHTFKYEFSIQSPCPLRRTRTQLVDMGSRDWPRSLRHTGTQLVDMAARVSLSPKRRDNLQVLGCSAESPCR